MLTQPQCLLVTLLTKTNLHNVKRCKVVRLWIFSRSVRFDMNVAIAHRFSKFAWLTVVVFSSLSIVPESLLLAMSVMLVANLCCARRSLWRSGRSAPLVILWSLDHSPLNDHSIDLRNRPIDWSLRLVVRLRLGCVRRVVRYRWRYVVLCSRFFHPISFVL